MHQRAINVFLALLLTVLVCSAQNFPAGTTMNWNPSIIGVPRPQDYQGVAGPSRMDTNRTIIWSNAVANGCDNTGVVDCTSKFLALMTACPSNEVVYFPAGTYKMYNVMDFGTANNWFTVRGAGIGQTIFDLQNNGIQIGSLDYLVTVRGGITFETPLNTNNITAGATAGSTNISCTVTANNFVAGTEITICASNGPGVYYNTALSYGFGPNNCGHDSNSLQTCTCYVTATNATSVSFWPPLPFTITTGATVTSWTGGITRAIGFEGITFDVTGSAGYALFIQQCKWCWVKNCEIENSLHHQIWWWNAVQCEMSGCYTHGTPGNGPDTEGIDWYQNDCFTLCENNTCIGGGFPAIIYGDWAGGCCGNVCDYNYVPITYSGESIAGDSICDNHGPHNSYNLFEGNVAQNFSSDGYYGSAGPDTLWRNYFSAYYIPNGLNTNQYQTAIFLAHWSYNFNLGANVLGSPSLSQTYIQTNANYSAASSVIYNFGYPAPGNRGYNGEANNSTLPSQFDFGVTNSVYLVANFDYATGTTVNPASGLPASLFYTNGPPGFWGSCPWPANDGASGMADGCPAQWASTGLWPCVGAVSQTTGAGAIQYSPASGAITSHP